MLASSMAHITRLIARRIQLQGEKCHHFGINKNKYGKTVQTLKLDKTEARLSHAGNATESCTWFADSEQAIK